MARTPYKMKGSPMQRNFGIGEKESPAKLGTLATIAVGAGISSLIGGGVSAKLAADKKVADDKRIAQEKRELAIKEAADGVTNEGKDKDKLV